MIDICVSTLPATVRMKAGRVAAIKVPFSRDPRRGGTAADHDCRTDRDVAIEVVDPRQRLADLAVGRYPRGPREYRMQFLKILFWFLLFVAALFTYSNWTSIQINMWSGRSQT